MPELSDEQWQALMTVFAAAWELVDSADQRGNGRQLAVPKSMLVPLRDALERFEVASGGQKTAERVEVRLP